MSNTPDFLTTTDLLAKYDVLIDGAEVHGIICGMLCGGMTLDNQDWLAVLTDVSNNSVPFAPELVTPLRCIL